MIRLLFVLLVLSIAFPFSPLPALSPVHPLQDQTQTPLVMEWESQIPFQASSWTVAHRRVIALHEGKLTAFPLLEGKLQNEPAAVPLDGLPDEFRPAHVIFSQASGRLILAGEASSAWTAFEAQTTPPLTLSRWEELPAIADPPGSLEAIVAVDNYLAAIVNVVVGTPRTAVQAINLTAPADRRSWYYVASPRVDRKGYAAVALKGALLLAGGNDEAGAAGTIDRLRDLGPSSGPWEKTTPFVSSRYGAVVGATVPAGVILGQALATTGEDAGTTQVLLLSHANTDGKLSRWREVPLALPPADLKAVLYEPANSQVIVAQSIPDGTTRLSGHDLPGYFNTARLTLEDAELALSERAAVAPRRVPTEQVILEARDSKGYGLVILVSDDSKEDVQVRSRMSGAGYRYMTQSVRSTYLKFSQQAEFASKHGVTKTPAFLLVDGEGNLVRSHAGSFPTPQELFELTAPSRAAKE